MYNIEVRYIYNTEYTIVKTKTKDLAVSRYNIEVRYIYNTEYTIVRTKTKDLAVSRYV